VDLAWVASDSHVQSGQLANSYSMDTNWDAPPAAAPRLSAQSAEEQEAWLPPVAAGTEAADSPTTVVVAWTQVVLEGGSLWSSLHEAESLGVAARGPCYRCLSFLFCLMS